MEKGWRQQIQEEVWLIAESRRETVDGVRRRGWDGAWRSGQGKAVDGGAPGRAPFRRWSVGVRDGPLGLEPLTSSLRDSACLQDYDDDLIHPLSSLSLSGLLARCSAPLHCCVDGGRWWRLAPSTLRRTLRLRPFWRLLQLSFRSTIATFAPVGPHPKLASPSFCCRSGASLGPAPSALFPLGRSTSLIDLVLQRL